MERIIWTYWHQGFENAPELVRSCVDSWEKKHSDWIVIRLNKDNYYQYTGDIPLNNRAKEKISLAHFSDLIRTKLLIEFGGVWADPTTFPLKNLNDWLVPNMASGIFLFQNPGRDRLISNWFIASEKKQEILVYLFEDLCAYWNSNNFINFERKVMSSTEILLQKVLNRNLLFPMFWFNPIMTKLFRLRPYMVYHYRFYYLIRKNKAFRNQFNLMKRIDAIKAHLVQEIGQMNEINEEDIQKIKSIDAPLFKLNWQTVKGEIPKNSLLGYTLNNL